MAAPDPEANAAASPAQPTRCLLVSAADPASTSADPIAAAAAVIRRGGLVAFPTETVYGLGANAMDAAAVAGIFRAKARPAHDPLIVHLAAAADLERVAHVALLPELLRPTVATLAAACWPGPLTLVLPRAAAVPAVVSAGRPTVAVRVPAHPVARLLIQQAQTPIAAPSANRFGHTSPTTAAHVLADLAGRIDMVLDSGPTAIGLESTVLDVTTTPPTVLRPGGISVAELTALIGPVALHPRITAHSDSPASLPDLLEGYSGPGMLARHYAPQNPLWLCSGPVEPARQWLRQQMSAAAAEGLHGACLGLLLCDEDAAALAAPLAAHAAAVEPLGPASDPARLAQRLYAALRALDARHPRRMLARDFGTSGLALALHDRLRRAADRVVVVG